MHPGEDHVIVGTGPVLLTLHADGVAHIELNRPDASNALDLELLRALHDVIMRCHGDNRIRAVLLTGEGKNFCGGGDVRDFAAKGAGLPDYLRQATAYLQIAAGALIALGAPVIASVQGFAAGGGGLGLVCCADLVIAGESTKFLAGATRVAMAPDAGLSVMLARIIGFRRAMDLLLTNSVLDAREALSLGFVNRVVADAELGQASRALAAQLAAGAPLALAATKRLLWRGLSLGVEAAMPEESRTVAQLAGSADAREGLAAVIEKRKPKFEGR